MRKVRIKGLPKAQQGGVSEGLKRFTTGNRQESGLNQYAEPNPAVNKSIGAVPREQANIEAERGEQAIVPGEGGIPESYTIGGKRHAQGGTPLNLADDSFIFSDHKKGMKIKDREVLKEFGASAPKKGRVKGKTPADLAKKFDLNEYKKILMDPNSDRIEKETAERMIKNYNLKLGKLALVQESMKGFPNEVPAIAMPYLEMIGADASQFMPQQEQQMPPQQFAEGGNVNRDQAERFPGLDIMRNGGEFDGAFWDSIMQRGGEKRRNRDKGTGIFQRMLNRAGVYGDDIFSMEDLNINVPLDNSQVMQPGVTTEATEATEVETSNKPTKVSNIPTSKRKTLDDPTLAEGDYYQENGSWYKVTHVPLKKEYKGDDFAQTFNSNTDVGGAYGFMEETFKDPKVKAEFAKKARAALKNKEYYKGKSGKYSEMYDETEIDNMTEDQLVEQFLKGQKRNYALQAYGIDSKDFEDSNGKLKKGLSAEKQKLYKDLGVSSLNEGFEKAGVPISQADIDAGELGLQQGTYWGYHDLIKDKNKLSPELQDKLQYFKEPQEGAGDEPFSTISPIDSKSNNFWTNTSAGQLAVVDDNLESELVDETFTETDNDIAVNDFNPVTNQAREEWWAQDIMNMGNLAGQRLGLKKYLPHSQAINLARPDVLYHDRARANAANNEQQQMMAQLLSGSGNSAQRAAQMSGITGTGFANAANILGDYENKNVAIGNQYLHNVQQTDNQGRLANNERIGRLYDQTTIANQQFDNSKRAANRNLVDGWIQGKDNQMMTQAMHTLYPQFETRPGRGGGMYYTGVPHSPFTNSGTPGSGDYAYLDEFTKLKGKYPEASDKAILQQMEAYGATPMSSVDPAAAEFMNMYANNRKSKGTKQVPSRGAYPSNMNQG